MDRRAQIRPMPVRRGRIGLILLMAVPAVARGQDPPAPDFALRVRASNVVGTGVLRIDLSQGTWDPEGRTYVWSLDQPMPVLDPETGLEVATLLNGQLEIQNEGRVRSSLNVSLLGGPDETRVEIIMPGASFIPLTAAEAEFRASAAVTVADADGNGAHVTAVGPPGAGVYKSFVHEVDESEQLFSELVNSVVVGPNGTATGSQNDPPFGYRPVGFAVDELRAEIAFEVSGNDLAQVMTSIGSPNTGRCPGDLNGDEVRDLSDLNVILTRFGVCDDSPSFAPAADLHPDGCINLDDLALMLRVFGVSCP